MEEILRGLDWSAWTQEYNGHVGQPPIPPWVMAGVILYGLMRRIRSSRQLEYACGNNIDFMWLAEGRTIDHDTLCKFRTKFKEPLKQLFKQIGRLAMRMGLIRLLEVAFDGTRVKANASRFHTWTAERVEAVLAGVGDAGRQDAQRGGGGRRQRRNACGMIARRRPCRPSWPTPRNARRNSSRCWQNSARPTRRGRRTGSRPRRRCPRPTPIPR